ncbi:MAG: OmpA family protein [Alphaproteobacteria bacterium]|nr:OmpA family protein [Alphaproteobacteria bacterium]
MLQLLWATALGQTGTDTDADGVDDARDHCPTEAGPEGEDPTVADGCPKAVWLGTEEIRVADGLAFPEGSADLGSAASLDAIAKLLRDRPELRVEVQGHTARHDDEAADLALSDRRAEAVLAALTSRGVSADRLVARGYGSTVPLYSNRTPQGRAQNERVQLLLLRQGSLDVTLAGGGWATVEVDGRWLSKPAPLASFPVQVGHHRLVVTNKLTGLLYETAVDVRVGETTTVVVPSP